MQSCKKEVYDDSSKSLLSALLFHYGEVKEYIELIKEEFFTEKYEKDIFKAIKELGQKDERFEKRDVWILLKSQGLNTLECERYLIRLWDGHKHFRILKDIEILEGFYNRVLLSVHLKDLVNDFKNDKFEQLTESVKVFQERLNNRADTLKAFEASGTIDKAFDVFEQNINEAKDEPNIKLSTGYTELDERTEIFRGGTLSTIAAKPGIGKTTFSINLIYNFIKELWRHKDKETGVGLVSLETRNRETLTNLLAISSKIPLNVVRNFAEGRAVEEGVKKDLQKEIEVVRKANILLNDDSTLKLEGICEWITKQVEKHKLKVVIIDHIQLVKTGTVKKEENLNYEVNSATRVFKQLALKHNICIIVLSQLNRRMDNRPEKEQEPQLADLRDSGGIEQDSDLVIFMTQNKSEDYLINFHIKKNRWGCMGEFTLPFNKNLGRFRPKKGF